MLCSSFIIDPMKYSICIALDQVLDQYFKPKQLKTEKNMSCV